MTDYRGNVTLHQAPEIPSIPQVYIQSDKMLHEIRDDALDFIQQTTNLPP